MIAVKRRNKTLKYMARNYDLYLFLLPTIIFLIIFSYLPIYGVQIAFKDFMPTDGILGSHWVGLKHFERLFRSAYFWPIVKNTIIISVYSLLVSFPAPLIFALMLNQMRSQRYKRVIQTITYAPNFISVVVVVGMLMLFLSPTTGLINRLIEWFGGNPVFFMMKPQLFSTIYVLSDVWQTAGWGAIIYLAALSGISPELHEAAIVDGASKLRRIWHIDIPGIVPVAMILLILSLGNLIGVGFEKVFLMQNPVNASVSEVISTYVYKVGLKGGDFSFSSAVGLLNNIVNFILLILVNRIAKSVSSHSLW
ncbi:ABC transporter permease [Cohnella soli]|uniref:ABC transporter permease n=1 Tax=Cohnella soli TaxID=425005 RepID=A0ABW0HN59_9BACL